MTSFHFYKLNVRDGMMSTNDYVVQVTQPNGENETI